MGSLAEISKCPNSVHLSRDSLIGQRPRNARCGCLSLRAGPRNWPSLSFSGSSCAQFANDAVPFFWYDFDIRLLVINLRSAFLY